MLIAPTILPVENAETEPRSAHVSNNKDDCMQLNEGASQIRRNDLSHPDWDRSENHKRSCASKETEDQEDCNVCAAG